MSAQAPVASAARVDPLRRALGHMATSVTLVTTRHDGTDHGFTANSFAAVSSSPAIVTVFLAETAECYGVFAQTDRIAVNILAEGQDELARVFATRGAAKFERFPRDERFTAVPVVDGAMASIVGAVRERWTVGDHLMILIDVEDVEYRGAEPLVYQNRAFRKLAGA